MDQHLITSEEKPTVEAPRLQRPLPVAMPIIGRGAKLVTIPVAQWRPDGPKFVTAVIFPAIDLRVRGADVGVKSHRHHANGSQVITDIVTLPNLNLRRLHQSLTGLRESFTGSALSRPSQNKVPSIQQDEIAHPHVYASSSAIPPIYPEVDSVSLNFVSETCYIPSTSLHNAAGFAFGRTLHSLGIGYNTLLGDVGGRLYRCGMPPLLHSSVLELASALEHGDPNCQGTLEKWLLGEMQGLKSWYQLGMKPQLVG